MQTHAGDRASWVALWIATLAFTVCFYGWTLYGPLAPSLQAALGLNGLQVSWLVAIPVVMGSLMRIPLGYLSQRYGGRVVFIALMVFVLLPLAAIALWHTSYTALLVFGFFLGFAGASFAAGVPFVSDWFPPQRRGFALGFYGIGGGGTVLAGLTVPALAAHGIWVPIVFAMVLVAVMIVIFAAFGRNAAVPASIAGSVFASFAVFGTSFRAWVLTLVYFITFGGFVALFLYLPEIFVGVYALTKTDAGFRAAGFAFVSIVARLIGGSLADRLGAERVLISSLATAVVMAAVLSATYTSMVPFTLCCLILAAAFGAGGGAVFKVVGTDFPHDVGAVTGVVGAAGGLGGFFPPLVMAVVKTLTGSYALGFALLGLVTAISLALVIKRT
jgi:MFS transporter, NNP family, nitrate/nitrite transporter